MKEEQIIKDIQSLSEVLKSIILFIDSRNTSVTFSALHGLTEILDNLEINKPTKY
jgi:hypothetical protein